MTARPTHELDLTVIDHAGLALDMIAAYTLLDAPLQARLEQAFLGNCNVAQTLALAADMLRTTRPCDMAMVLTRLIFMSNETPLELSEVPQPKGGH